MPTAGSVQLKTEQLDGYINSPSSIIPKGLEGLLNPVQMNIYVTHELGKLKKKKRKQFKNRL
jgi:hypothetical protein